MTHAPLVKKTQAAPLLAASGRAKQTVPATNLLSGASLPAPLLRKCACGGSGECKDCEEKEKKKLQKKNDGPPRATEAPPIVNQVLRQSGQPLDPATRAFMEPRFGHDFSQVRVHTDAQAGQSARAVQARAYTVGQDIAFAPGQYAPHTNTGGKLLAHELSHTLQQRGLQRSADTLSGLSPTEDRRYEAEADRMAEQVMTAPGAARAVPVKATRTARLGLSRAEEFGVCGMNPTEEGTAAHDQIEEAVNPGVKELQVPRATKQGGKVDETRCQPAGTEAGFVDLWWKEGNTLKFAEIKPIGTAKKAGQNQAIKEIEHYMRRADQSMDRFCGEGKCASKAKNPKVAEDDKQFADRIGPIPQTDGKCETRPKFDPKTFNHEIKVIGPFKKNPARLLNAEFFTTGAVGYWCTKPGAKDKSTGGTISIEVKLGGEIVTLDMPAQGAAAIDESKQRTFRGLLLKKITKKNNTTYLIGAQVDGTPDGQPGFLTIPATNINLVVTVSKDNPGKGEVDKQAIKTNIKIDLKLASPGTITKVTPNEDGTVNWEGVIHPTIPVLPAEVRLAYENGKLRVETGKNTAAGAAKGKASPIFRLTKSTVGLNLAPELGAEGDLEGQFGPEGHPIADASAKVTLDKNGLAAQGKLKAHIPGLQEATFDVFYEKGNWRAHIEVSAGSAKLPLSPQGTVVVDIDEKGIQPSGELTMTLPGKAGTVTLQFLRDKGTGRFVFSGKGSLFLPIPGMKEQPVTVGAKYDGEDFRATAGGIKFSWHDLEGTLDSITYHVKAGGEGKTSGSGKLVIKRKGVTGSLEVHYNEEGTFSGKGTVNYPFQIGGNEVVASAGVTLEKQKVHVNGDMKFPKPIQLFRRFGDRKSLFHVQKNIPLPGVSIGPVGIVAVVEGGVDIHYYFGPGELRNVEVKAELDPLEPDPDVSAMFHCELNIPAEAGISGTVGGGIGVDAGLGSVTGTLTVTAGLNLDGALGGPLDVQYAHKKMEVTAKPGLDAQLALGLSLDAHARAQAGIGRFSIGVEKDWNLGHRDIKLGQFGMHAPIKWSSDGGFQPPGLDQIEWTTPTVSFDDVLTQLMEGAPAKEAKT